MRELYLPAEYAESEGLDGPWDDDSDNEGDQKLNEILDGSREVTRDEAVKVILSAIGTKLDDADLTEIH